ncbi:hypothetical protein [Streptomyces sp. NPDC091268]|uniref:hypothetical protein n=1 Tax=Streptomyces sp. NPDC091268 TaxID=3365979 RepID=UPI00382956A0
MAWKIMLNNGTAESFETALVSVYAQYGTAGEQSGQVFDVPKGAGGFRDLEVIPHPFTYEGTHWSGRLDTQHGRGWHRGAALVPTGRHLVGGVRGPRNRVTFVIFFQAPIDE